MNFHSELSQNCQRWPDINLFSTKRAFRRYFQNVDTDRPSFRWLMHLSIVWRTPYTPGRVRHCPMWVRQFIDIDAHHSHLSDLQLVECDPPQSHETDLPFQSIDWPLSHKTDWQLAYNDPQMTHPLTECGFTRVTRLYSVQHRKKLIVIQVDTVLPFLE